MGVMAKSIVLCCALLVLTSCRTTAVEMEDIAPDHYTAKDKAGYMLNGNYSAQGRHGMIVSTTGAPAVRAGAEVLREGGSAADAVLTTSLAQIALAAGSWVSYAGIMTMVYYDAEKDSVQTLHAGYRTVRDERDPHTIPEEDGLPSGRTALVPGYMAGVQAAHEKYGKVPFKRLFAPAVRFAAEGFKVYPALGFLFDYREKVLTRLPDTKQVFTRPDGSVYRTGDLFTQPALAQTLRRVAAQGATYMYNGGWAQKFVKAVRGQGGKMTMADLSDYKVQWTPPLHTRYQGYDVYTLGLPDTGGVNLIEALHLLELADLKQYGHYSSEPESLFRLIQIARVAPLFTFLPEFHTHLEAFLPGRSFSHASRIEKQTAKVIWEAMKKKTWPTIQASAAERALKAVGHSDAIVAVDRFGNVAAVVHSINTSVWGHTGIAVDGVTIPDSACFQQMLIKSVGPGAYLPNRTNPTLIFKNGKCVLACSSVGNGLHEVTLQNLHNILDFNMPVGKSVQAPNFYTPDWSDWDKQIVIKGTFSKELQRGVKKLGQPLKQLSADDSSTATGTWVGLQIDRQTGEISGAIPPDNLLYRCGHAEGL